ncbi:hypothetical protein GOV07_04815 [Candidatus Woesearchaeota archaeon]|nr:hypothetical protein [Candidatus Woesearchaeota archaeon]
MSVFQGVIVFFRDVGMYDVILPFLLVFTLIYALLEKTKILGVERVGDKEYTKKNVNSMLAFVCAFFVVASSKLVAAINQLVGSMVLLLVLLVCFMLLVGSMHKDDKSGFELKGFYRNAFYVIMFVGMILIFLNSVGWLQAAWGYTVTHLDSQLIGMIMLLIIIIALMVFVTRDPSAAKKEKKEEKKES